MTSHSVYDLCVICNYLRQLLCKHNRRTSFSRVRAAALERTISTVGASILNVLPVGRLDGNYREN